MHSYASNPVYLSDSASRISTITGVLSSNPTVFTMPVYEVTSTTPLKPVRFSGIYSNVTAAGTRNLQTGGGTVNVPIPNGAQQASGSDAQIILWNRATGDEWAFWQFANGTSGATAKNGYHYNTNWSGVPPAGFASRGAGVPYLTGLIRPCEIKQGHIDHPIAFGFDSPQPHVFVYPATKTDGSGTTLVPEGARLQLDPTLPDNTITGWGCTGLALSLLMPCRSAE